MMTNNPSEESSQTYAVPASETASKEITLLPWSAPLRWLRLGWRDLAAHPVTSVFFGLPFLFMALILHGVFHIGPEYSMTMISGCLLVGPFVAMGLNDLSRRDERGFAPDFIGSLTCWKGHLGSMGLLVGVLLVLALLWGRVSLVVTALFFNTNIPSDFDLMDAALDADNWEFVATYSIVGAAFATLIFSLLVVSIPMILDRDTDAITAAITSLMVVGKNAAVMLLWAALIGLAVLVSVLLTQAVGLLVVGPLLGHASWHAYRDAVR
jgi:uncharacterized membrane protein